LTRAKSVRILGRALWKLIIVNEREMNIRFFFGSGVSHPKTGVSMDNFEGLNIFVGSKGCQWFVVVLTLEAWWTKKLPKTPNAEHIGKPSPRV
jgi:hypothetical protein